MNNINRRLFIQQGAVFSTGFLLPGLAPLQPQPVDPIPREKVEEFVRLAHSDFGKMEAILNEFPHIIHATHDWGDGDFETAAGAAGHMGLRDEALFLLEKGARVDIFVLTMLGEVDLVKPMLEKYPQLLQSTGPHGFTLLHHAKKGGSYSAELLDYLSAKGLTETIVKMYKK